MIFLEDDTCYCLLRCGGPGRLGIAEPPSPAELEQHIRSNSHAGFDIRDLVLLRGTPSGKSVDGYFLWADDFLASAKIETEVPLLGTLKATTALPFDIGVYLVVFGSILTLVFAMEEEI